MAVVIGTKKFIYDLWGHGQHRQPHGFRIIPVELRSVPVGSQGLPGRIQVTQRFYACLQGQAKFQFEKRGVINVKRNSLAPPR